MLKKHQAILLKNTKYGDSSVISNFFSAQEGLLAVISRGVRKSAPKKTSTAGLYQLLSPCELVVQYHKNSGLGIVKELKNTPPLVYLCNHPQGILVTTYMANLLLQFVHDNNVDEGLFEFTQHYIQQIEANQLQFKDIPLHFTCHLLQLTGYLPKSGFEYSGVVSIQSLADDDEMNAVIEMCLKCPVEGIADLEISQKLRKQTLGFLVNSASTILQNNKLNQVYEQIKDILNA